VKGFGGVRVNSEKELFSARYVEYEIFSIDISVVTSVGLNDVCVQFC
jgi:hypothetical protein